MDGEILATLRDVVARLTTLEIEYMLTGSIALGYYVEPRMTRDIDIVIELQTFDPPAFLREFGGDYYAPEELVRGANERGRMFNIIQERLIVKVDFVIRRDGQYRSEEFARRRKADLQGIQCWLVAPEDLLLSKLIWMSESRSSMQSSDVKRLLRVDGLDHDYLQRWARHLQVDSSLRELMNE